MLSLEAQPTKLGQDSHDRAKQDSVLQHNTKNTQDSIKILDHNKDQENHNMMEKSQSTDVNTKKTQIL